MGLFRKLLKIYRFLLSIIFGKSNIAVMQSGIGCNIEAFEFELNKGDVVHPCIRYSEKPFKGHHWWLVYTPYYNANSDLENPILCYGVGNGNVAPVKWKVFKEIIKKPKTGYNSDPTMFFDDEGLNIYWRENHTPRTQKDNVERSTYGCVITENDNFFMEKPILTESNLFSDKEVSPTIIKHKKEYIAYAMHLRFKNPKLYSTSAIFNKIVKFPLIIAALLEIYNEQKSYGISIWKSNKKNEPFSYSKTIKLKNCNRLYRPWHLDIFEYNNKCYAIVQTNQCNADICLAVSEDYENFTMFKKPLITNESINKIGIYKPTAITHNNIFYLYYTAQDLNNRALNKLYQTSMPFKELLEKLK